MQKIGLISRQNSDKVREVSNGVSDWLIKQGYDVMLFDDLEKAETDFFVSKSAEHIPDMIIAVGGDGTLLNTARKAAPAGIPILGINMGNLGFLTEVEVDSVYENLAQVFSGCYVEDSRMMLQADIVREGRLVKRLTGLNEATIHSGALTLLGINFWVDIDFAGNCKGDGIIIASPTGSTAYSLSAGGPVAHPSLEVFIQTWICPHTITARPAVIPADKECIMELETAPLGALVTTDGHNGFDLIEKDKVIIKKAPYKATFIRLAPLKFFSLLKSKLGSEAAMHGLD